MHFCYACYSGIESPRHSIDKRWKIARDNSSVRGRHHIENKNNYADNEIIIFTEIDIMSIPAEPSIRTIQQIEDSIKGKFIKCEIETRSNDELTCKVFHSGAGGY